MATSFPILGKFSVISSCIFSWPLFLSSSSGTPDLNVGTFNIVPEVSEVVLTYNFFFLFSSPFHLFPPFYLLPHLSSASVILLLVPSRVLLMSVIALFIID